MPYFGPIVTGDDIKKMSDAEYRQYRERCDKNESDFNWLLVIGAVALFAVALVITRTIKFITFITRENCKYEFLSVLINSNYIAASA